MPASQLELVSPERFFAPEMGGMNHVPYMRSLPREGRRDHHQHAADVRCGATATSWSRRCASDFADGWRERAARRPGGGRARHAAARRSLSRAEAAVEESSARSTTRRWSRAATSFPTSTADGGLHAVPHRRRGRRAQHPRRDLRCCQVRAAGLGLGRPERTREIADRFRAAVDGRLADLDETRAPHGTRRKRDSADPSSPRRRRCRDRCWPRRRKDR